MHVLALCVQTPRLTPRTSRSLAGGRDADANQQQPQPQLSSSRRGALLQASSSVLLGSLGLWCAEAALLPGRGRQFGAALAAGGGQPTQLEGEVKAAVDAVLDKYVTKQKVGARCVQLAGRSLLRPSAARGLSSHADTRASCVPPRHATVGGAAAAGLPRRREPQRGRQRGRVQRIHSV
jgi:hypothetical protein